MTDTKEKLLVSYSSKLGEELFPGDDFWSCLYRSRLSEALAKSNSSSVDEFIDFLSSFIPLQISDSEGEWSYKRELKRWVDVERPNILNKISEKFLGGGKQK